MKEERQSKVDSGNHKGQKQEAKTVQSIVTWKGVRVVIAPLIWIATTSLLLAAAFDQI